jgi:hypothetical protein
VLRGLWYAYFLESGQDVDSARLDGAGIVYTKATSLASPPSSEYSSLNVVLSSTGGGGMSEACERMWSSVGSDQFAVYQRRTMLMHLAVKRIPSLLSSIMLRYLSGVVADIRVSTGVSTREITDEVL